MSGLILVAPISHFQLTHEEQGFTTQWKKPEAYEGIFVTRLSGKGQRVRDQRALTPPQYHPVPLQ